MISSEIHYRGRGSLADAPDIDGVLKKSIGRRVFKKSMRKAVVVLDNGSLILLAS